MKLSALISDRMVLQRNKENKIWGYTEPEREISVQLGQVIASTESNKMGYFNVVLPALQAGGPYEMTIRDGLTEVLIEDVMVGDVYLLGGQSNMELPIERTLERYEEEVKRTKEPEIRMFEVPKEYSFEKNREELEQGQWVKAEGEALLGFSAAGYFAAKELREREGVAIGLLQTAVGGTPVKAWCSKDTVKKLGYDQADLAECIKPGYIEKVTKQEAAREQQWWQSACSPYEEQKNREKDTIQVPGFFAGTKLDGFCGSLKICKKVILPELENWEKAGNKLYLGAIVDADITYINGYKVGETGYRYPPRIYQIPAGVLHSGENLIEIHMLSFRGIGGFMPGKQYEIRFGKKKDEAISLSGTWEYEVVQPMELLPDSTFFQYKASGLYQGMLYPIRNWSLCGCFFYQGESNTGRPETYEEEFRAMIRDWRVLWNNPKLPMLYVQLAGFSDGQTEHIGTNWAELREQQWRAEQEPYTKMVQAYDLGEYNDLHPTDKKTVGMRLALAAEQVIYGKDIICQGPILRETYWEKEGVRVSFETVGDTLCIRKEGAILEDTEVTGFSFRYENGEKKTVTAKLKGAYEVLVPYPTEGKNNTIVGLDFAWNDCPLDANLYGSAGFPVVPFEIPRKGNIEG